MVQVEYVLWFECEMACEEPTRQCLRITVKHSQKTHTTLCIQLQLNMQPHYIYALQLVGKNFSYPVLRKYHHDLLGFGPMEHADNNMIWVWSEKEYI